MDSVPMSDYKMVSEANWRARYRLHQAEQTLAALRVYMQALEAENSELRKQIALFDVSIDTIPVPEGDRKEASHE